jgi:hypothetical protein
LQSRHGTLTAAAYGRLMRLIVALTGAVTILLLLLPVHT